MSFHRERERERERERQTHTREWEKGVSFRACRFTHSVREGFRVWGLGFRVQGSSVRVKQAQR